MHLALMMDQLKENNLVRMTALHLVQLMDYTMLLGNDSVVVVGLIGVISSEGNGERISIDGSAVFTRGYR